MPFNRPAHLAYLRGTPPAHPCEAVPDSLVIVAGTPFLF